MHKLLLSSFFCLLTLAVRAQSADVATTLAQTPATPAVVAPGAAITYTVSVLNNGPASASNVQPRVQLPAGLAATTLTLPAGASYTNATGLLTLPTSATLASGPANALSYSITLTAPAYSTTIGAVASSGATSADPTPGNNNGSAAAAQASTTVVLPPNGCGGTPYGPNTSSGLYAEYYAGYFADNLAFFNTNTPALTRYDARLNFAADNSWGNLAPASSGNADQPQVYSARYRGNFSVPASGTYTLSLTADDAAYLWLDGAALAAVPTLASVTINNGGLHGTQTVSATVTLPAGAHNVLIFYGQNQINANLTFSYAGGPTNLPTQPVPNAALCATQVPIPVANVQTTLSVSTASAQPGAPITYTVTVLNNGPDPAQSVTPQVQLPAGLVASGLTLPAGATYSNTTGLVTLPTISSLAVNAQQAFTITLTAPNYSITIGAVASSGATSLDPTPANNNGSAAAAQASTTVVLPTNGCTGTGYGPAAPVSSGLYAEYYAGYFADNLAFFNTNTPALSRYDALVNFPADNSWGNLAPAASGNADQPQVYSARYRGTINVPALSTYMLSLNSDDASYLWLDGAALAAVPTLGSATLSNGGQHGPQTVSATVTLTAGLHNVLIFYGQNGGGNVLSFNFSGGPTNLPTQPVPNIALCAAQVPVPQADLTTTLTRTSAATVAPGASVSYTVTLSNAGPGTAQGITTQVQLPAGLTSAAFTSLPAGASYSNATGVLTLPFTSALAASGSASFSFTFAAPNYSATLLGKASSTTASIDPTPANNNGSAAAAQASTAVVLPPNGCGGTPYGSSASSGLYAEYYVGNFDTDLAYFNTNTPALTRYDAQLNFPADNTWGSLTPAASNNADQPLLFSARYRGSLNIAATGTYTLSLKSDDGSYLWLDGAALAATPTLASATIQNGGTHGAATVSATVTLTAGLHNVLIFYGQGPTNSVLQFYYAGGPTNLPTQLVPNSALCATKVQSPLPVQLTTFTATAAAAGSAAELAWTTASELNSAYFGVERSLDGTRFGELGRVAAQGNKASATSYTFRDAGFGSVAAAQPVYYRLRQVDLDGTVAYSPVRSLLGGNAAPSVAAAPVLRCYPVPATADGTTLDLSDLPAQAYQVTLLDVAGRTLRRWQLVGGQAQPLALPGLSAGLYQLLITGTTAEGRAFRQGVRLPKE